MVGRMARGEQHFEAVIAYLQNFFVGQFTVGLELALGVGRAGRRQTQNGRYATCLACAHGLQRLCAW